MQNQLINRQTVTGNVAEYVTDRIVSGYYKSGQQIRQEALAKELGVSRVPVREALLQLEAEGLIQIITHRGAIVSPISIEDAVDVFEAREVLEHFILAKAVERADQADYERASSAVNAYEKAIAQDATPGELSRLNWDFHIALLQPAARPRSVYVIRTLYTSLDRYLRMQIRANEAKTRAVKDHRNIFDAYAARDVEAVIALSKQHIQAAYDEVLQTLSEIHASGVER